MWRKPKHKPRILASVRFPNPEMQRERIKKFCVKNKADLVGFAYDRCDGNLSPWERSGLAPWLTDHAHDWDWLVADTVDRITENLVHGWYLLKWCDGEGKVIKTTDGFIDTSETRVPSQWIELFAEAIRASCGLGEHDKRVMIDELDRITGHYSPETGLPRLLTHSRDDQHSR